MLHEVQNTKIYNTYSDSSITKQFLHIYHYKMYIYKLFSEYKAYKVSDRQFMWRITTCFGIWQWSSTNYCFIVRIHFIAVRPTLLDLNCECESEDVIS